MENLTGLVRIVRIAFDTNPFGFLICFVSGAVAQLAERRVRNAEARSSTLLCSTSNPQSSNHLKSQLLKTRFPWTEPLD
jgi:hypothetical protein